MISVLSVVIVGLVIGWWFGASVGGWKAYPLAALAALIAVPAAGFIASQLDALLLGADVGRQRSIALGLGLAVALIEVPLLVFKGRRRDAVSEG
jgi:hypothetical protein